MSLVPGIFPVNRFELAGLIARGSCDTSQIQSVLRDSSDSAATPAGLLVAEIEASGPGISETVLARCGVTRGVFTLPKLCQ